MKQTPFGLVWKVLKKHWKDHILIPFVIGIILELSSEWAIGYLGDHHHSLPLTILRIGILVFSLIITYFIIIWQIQKKDAKYVYTDQIRNLLDDTLEGATRYFAVSIGDIERWFVPSSLMYFLDLLRFDSVKYERIFVFIDEEKYKFDEDFYQGESMANVLFILHKQADIKAACFSPKEFNEILDSLEPETKKKLKINQTWLGYCRRKFKMTKSNKRVMYQRKQIELNLDFAYVEKPGDDCVLLTDKDNEPDRITNRDMVEAYKDLVAKIEAKIYIDDEKTKLKTQYSFRLKANLGSDNFELKRLKIK